MANLLKDLPRRVRTLHSIAERDDIYLTWKYAAEDAKANYERTMRFLPRKLQRIIRSYVDCEVARAQSLNTIACRSMEFLPEVLKEYSQEMDIE